MTNRDPDSTATSADPADHKIMTVTGPVSASALGHTLMHEHILNDCSCWWHKPTSDDRRYLAEAKVGIELLSELRQDPFVCRHNIALDDEALAAIELQQFVDAGGCSVIDPTCRGIGRNPAALVRIAQATGLNIIMGAGYYLHSSHPSRMSRLGANDIADEIVEEAEAGVDGSGIRIGLIGEIGVSSDFTEAEQRSLTGAARAQVRTDLPLMVHLPGWFRLGHDVLDRVEAEGVDPRQVVLCHMNPSHHDTDYQRSLAARGAFIEYDMIGMDYFYADQQVQCPGDDEAARGICALADAGYLDRILLSHDVFLKMMLTRYGGNGYAFVTRHFLPRLQRFGFDTNALERLMVSNPRSVFEPNKRQ